MNGAWRNSDLAIIGLSCRFPGADTTQDYWDNLCKGVESITFFSNEELVAAGADPALVADPRYVKAAAMLRNVDMFDESFFGYSPKDAASMDPQHRLFLEVCWETFENAGYDPVAYPGKIGVLSTAGGVVTSYLLAKLHHAEFPGQTASTSHINNDKDFLSTRVSYKLNLRGPSFTIQSACSSSLLAVHQACQNLRFNECDMMLVGGSVVRVPQVEGYLAEKRNVHSLDGHCRPFDAVGQGTIFGSGVGAVLLKPLQQAIADRDHIFAVIKGTAANNDGSAKNSYTAPSLGQQSQAVIDALASAGVSADSIGYVECHATGTTVGDPLEIEALTAAFRNQTAREQYCAIGSVKANIGHPEQAAGIAGLIKTALVLHHKRIPPSINYQAPNPAIDFASSPFYVNTALRDFAATGTPRRAALNSLGIGGTNAFAVLEEAPPLAAQAAKLTDSLPRVVTLSAKSAEALRTRVEQFLNWLNDNPDAPVGDLCYTTNVSRSQFAFRFAAPAASIAELKKHLAAWLRTAAAPADLPRGGNTAIAFMFSGQGAQHAGMAAQLYRAHVVFRVAMDRCDAIAKSHLEHGLLDVIFSTDSDAGLLNRTDYTQPALFAVEYALTELLKSWGIVPGAVIGHSLGEFVAACSAGVFSLEDAMQLVIARGALMCRLPDGGMAAVFAAEPAVRALIATFAPALSVAAMNGPANTVVSGDRDELKKLLDELGRQGTTYRELQVSHAFHSSHTDLVLDALETVAGRIKHQAPRLPLISNFTGEPIAAAPDKFYWRRHLREPVRFGDGMLALAELGCCTFLEVGPHPVLLPIAQACLGAKARGAAWAATLARQKTDAQSTSEMLAALYRAGHTINWAGVHADASWRRIPLPTYPFRRKRHWIEDNSARSRPIADRPHPLVGVRTSSTPNEICFETRYGVRHTGFLSDHKIAGTIVLPTTAGLEAATAVGRMHFATSLVTFDEAMHHQAMSFSNGEDRTVRIILTPLKSGGAGFRLVSAENPDSKTWQTHMTGTLRKSDATSGPGFSAKQLRDRCPRTLPAADVYDRLGELGLEYGTGFRGIRELYLGQHEALTKVKLPHDLHDAQFVMHPAFLDACLHVYPLILDGVGTLKHNGGSTYLPVSLERFRCHRDTADGAWVHSRLRTVEKDGTQVIDVRIYDEGERPLADLEGLRVRLLPLAMLQSPPARADNLFYRADWRQSVRNNVGTDRAPASWMILADEKGVGVALARKLEDAGHHCHLIYKDSAFGRRGKRTWTVNERQPHDFRRLLEQFGESEGLTCNGVIYLWGLDAPSMENLALAGLKSCSEAMCRGALAILQALAKTRSANSAGRRLWLVTANTQNTGSRSQIVDPVQSPLWGLGRTAAIEYPGLWGGLIDLELNSDGMPNVDALAAEILSPDGETQIAISADGQRHVQRFVAQPLDELPAKAAQIRGDATYLVTGGLGMLGRRVAGWLMSCGAKHIVLTGRQANRQTAQELLSTARKFGASIRIVAADISRDEDVRSLLNTIGKELPPLRGIVHSAGVLDDGILAQLDWDRFARVFEPKVYGSWLLHEHTKSLELDFFILQSSLLSLLGSAGQANYSAGNSFLDSLAAHRRAARLPATAINWSAWSGGGLATLSGARGKAMWSSLGVEFVPPELAMQAFDQLMHRDVGQIAVAIADWPVYARKVGRPPFLAELLNGKSGFGSPNTARPSDAPIVHGIRDGRQQLLARLQQRIMAELGFTDPINPDQPLNEIGLDSLRSVTLANNLEDEFGVLIAISELITGPTINQLADHLSGLLEQRAKDVGSGDDSSPIHVAPLEANDRAVDDDAVDPAPNHINALHYFDAGTNENGSAPSLSGNGISHDCGKWLVAPRPNPDAKARLFCFPYAGGGLVSFRTWAQLLGDNVEVVAIEAPGRGTRINEAAVDDLDTFVAHLLPEMTAWLDRPSAFFGHCLGGLTMFATLCALPDACSRYIKHVFACGVRPPHLLKRRREFEDNLLYDMMLRNEFDVRVPPYAQSDEIFADIIRQFDTPAANKMLEIPRLRKLLLPTIRAEFGMAYKYEYRPVEPFAFPISSFVGDADPWVSEEDSAGWSEFTRGEFNNHVRKGSHFLMADDGDYILKTISREFVKSVA